MPSRLFISAEFTENQHPTDMQTCRHSGAEPSLHICRVYREPTQNDRFRLFHLVGPCFFVLSSKLRLIHGLCQDGIIHSLLAGPISSVPSTLKFCFDRADMVDSVVIPQFFSLQGGVFVLTLWLAPPSSRLLAIVLRTTSDSRALSDGMESSNQESTSVLHPSPNTTPSSSFEQASNHSVQQYA